MNEIGESHVLPQPAERSPHHGFVKIRDGLVQDTNVIALPTTQRWFSFPVWPCRALLALGFCLSIADVAWSQPKGAKPAPKVQPGRGAQPGNPQEKGNKQAPPAKGTPQPLVIEPDALPDGFVPPKEQDSRIKEATPLALPSEMNDLKKDDAKFLQTINRGVWDEPSKTVIHNSIRYRLSKMCLEENLKKETLNELYKIRVDLLRALNAAGSTNKDINPTALRKFRLDVMQDFVKQATPLLKNNLYVREQVVILMGELELVQEDNKKNIAVEAFTPAFEPLMAVIADPEQPVSVKLLAVNRLTRILKIGTPNVNERTRIAEAIIAELTKTDTHWWYQMRLAGALGSVALGDQKQPIVVKALKDAVSDPKRVWSVRTEAAMSLGRVPLPAASNPSSVVIAVADLALQLAKAAQQKPNDPKWKTEFTKVYFAFQAVNANEKDVTKNINSKAGLLNNPASKASAAAPYALIAPMVSAILNGKPLTAPMLSALEEWLKATMPNAGSAKPAPPEEKQSSSP